MLMECRVLEGLSLSRSRSVFCPSASSRVCLALMNKQSVSRLTCCTPHTLAPRVCVVFAGESRTSCLGWSSERAMRRRTKLRPKWMLSSSRWGGAERDDNHGKPVLSAEGGTAVCSCVHLQWFRLLTATCKFSVRSTDQGAL